EVDFEQLEHILEALKIFGLSRAQIHTLRLPFADLVEYPVLLSAFLRTFHNLEKLIVCFEVGSPIGDWLGDLSWLIQPTTDPAPMRGKEIVFEQAFEC